MATPVVHSAHVHPAHVVVGGGVTEVVSPLVDIRSRLVNRTNTEMFTVEAAAGRYFNKPAQKLTIAEAAMLAGLVRSPNVMEVTNNFPAKSPALSCSPAASPS